MLAGTKQCHCLFRLVAQGAFLDFVGEGRYLKISLPLERAPR